MGGDLTRWDGACCMTAAIGRLRLTHWLVTGLTLGVLACGIGTGCGDSAPQSYVRIELPTIKPGTAFPAPTGPVVLTVTGKTGTLNTKTGVELDLATLQHAGVVDLRVADPIDRRMVRYSGPLMGDLLDLLQVPTDATTLHVVSANDVAVDVPIADLRKFPVVLGMKADGELLDPSFRGPLILAWPYDTYTFDHAVYDPLWCSQIKAIDVR